MEARTRRSVVWTAALTGAALLAACGSEEPSSPFAPTDPAGDLFAPGHVVEVSIDIAPTDWDALRRQSRTWWDVVAVEDGRCLTRPFPKPFTWFRASITVDGIRRENVAVRKKGFLGSLDDEKPALKVRFDLYDPGQTRLGLDRLILTAFDRWGPPMRRHLTLSVTAPDPDAIREVVRSAFPDARVTDVRGGGAERPERTCFSVAASDEEDALTSFRALRQRGATEVQAVRVEEE